MRRARLTRWTVRWSIIWILIWLSGTVAGAQTPITPTPPTTHEQNPIEVSTPQPIQTQGVRVDPNDVVDPTLLEHEVVVLTNRIRVEAGLAPLKLHEALRTAARQHAQDMAENNFFDHIGSDGSTLVDRINRVNYPNWLYAAENIAAGFARPADVVQAWLDSPYHRANLLHPDLKEIGVGYAYDPNDQANVRLWDGSIGGPYYHYWVQDFGTRIGAYPVLINLDAYSTLSPEVDLYIYGEGWAKQMRVSNYPDFRDARWQPFRSTMTWTLLPGSGTRTVYVQLKDAIGITINSSDSIELLPPPDPSSYGLEINGGAAYTNQRDLSVHIKAPSGTERMRLSFSSDLSSAPWQPYTPDIRMSIPERREGRVTIYGQIQTKEGWESPVFSDTITVDLSPPAGEVIIRERQPRQLKVLVMAEDPISGVSEMQVGLDPELANVTWQPYTPQVVVPLSGDAGANQTAKVYARFRDRAGNESPIYPATELTLDQRTFLPFVTH